MLAVIGAPIAVAVILLGPAVFELVFGASGGAGVMAALMAPWYWAALIVGPLSRVAICLPGSGLEADLRRDEPDHRRRLPHGRSRGGTDARGGRPALSLLQVLVYGVYFLILYYLVGRARRQRRAGSGPFELCFPPRKIARLRGMATIISATAVVDPRVVIGEVARVIGDYVILAEPAAIEGVLRVGRNAAIRSPVIYTGSTIGDRFQTGHGVMIRQANEIGSDVSVGSRSIVEHHVVIGDGARIHSNAFVPEISVIEEGAWIGPPSR